jgi:hypothetical protein
MQDDLDRNLQSLFHEHSQNLPEEPFLTDLIKLLEKEQAWKIWERRLVFLLALFCCFLLSPFLLRGAELLSSGLDLLFDATCSLIATPKGMLIAGLCALPFLIFNRKMILEYVRGG